MFEKNRQYKQFCAYGFLKNLRFFEPFLILFLNSEGISFTQIGLLYGFREVIRNLTEIPAGVFADLFGRKKSLLIAFSSYLLSFVIFLFSGNFWLFGLAFFLYAFGDAFRTGTHKAIILTYLELHSWQSFKVHYYGHTRSWSQIGSAVSALLAGVIVLLFQDYRIGFLISILPYLAQLINLSLYPKELNFSANSPSVEQNLRGQIRETTRSFIQTFRKPELRLAVLGLSMYSGYYKASKDFIQPIIRAFAISLPIVTALSLGQKEAILVGLVYFIIYLSTSQISKRAGSWVEKQRSPEFAMRKTLVLGVLAGLGSGLFIVFGWTLIGLILFSGIYLFENLRKPVGIGTIADYIEPGILASALSAESQAETIFAAIFAVLLGFLIDATNLGAAFAILSLLVLGLHWFLGGLTGSGNANPA